MPPYEDRAFIQVKIWPNFEYMQIAKLFYLQCSLSFKDKNNHKNINPNGLVIKMI
jgi:hypothetical protein